jgi:hypothetical protein
MKDKIFNVYSKCILEIAKSKYPNVRKRKYELGYYLKAFIRMLKNVNKWEEIVDKSDNCKEYHWKTISNEFIKWTKDGIFKEAFNTFLINNYFKFSNVKQNKQINMFIDVTKINNWKGSEGICINVEWKKKNITPIILLCDDNKLPIGVTNLKIKNTYKNGRKSSCHDVKGIQDVLDTIPFKIPTYVSKNIIGDKGFITSDNFYIENQKVNIITPKRKNQYKKNTKKQVKKLRKRYKIENVFSTLKSNNRIRVRMETKLSTFFSFLYLSILEVYKNFIYKNNINLQILK